MNLDINRIIMESINDKINKNDEVITEFGYLGGYIKDKIKKVGEIGEKAFTGKYGEEAGRKRIDDAAKEAMKPPVPKAPPKPKIEDLPIATPGKMLAPEYKTPDLTSEQKGRMLHAGMEEERRSVREETPKLVEAPKAKQDFDFNPNTQPKYSPDLEVKPKVKEADSTPIPSTTPDTSQSEIPKPKTDEEGILGKALGAYNKFRTENPGLHTAGIAGAGIAAGLGAMSLARKLRRTRKATTNA